jgi:pheromone a factor receptor
MATRSDNRRAVMIDLLIGIGIPILQMVMREYHQSLLSTYTHAIQSTLFRDIVTTYLKMLAPVKTLCPCYWPCSSATHGLWRLVVYLSFIVVSILVWSSPFGPSLGSSSTAMTIYAFYKRVHQFEQLMTTNRNLNRGRYFRLMALSSIEIIGTIPFGTYFLVNSAKWGLGPWRSWAY